MEYRSESAQKIDLEPEISTPTRCRARCTLLMSSAPGRIVTCDILPRREGRPSGTKSDMFFGFAYEQGCEAVNLLATPKMHENTSAARIHCGGNSFGMFPYNGTASQSARRAFPLFEAGCSVIIAWICFGGSFSFGAA